MIIFLLICLLISLLSTMGAGYLCYKTIIKNFELQDLQKEYKRFHTLMLDVLEEDTQFMKTEIIKRFTLDIPETRAVNSGILKFENRLSQIKTTLKEYKMMED